MTNEQPKDEKKVDIPAIMNQKPIPPGIQVVPQPMQQLPQPTHPTGKVQNQLEQIWQQVLRIDSIGKGFDFFGTQLSQYGLIDFIPKTNSFEAIKSRKFPYPALLSLVKGMKTEIDQIKTDLQLMKKMILGEQSPSIPCHQAPLRQILETPAEKNLQPPLGIPPDLKELKHEMLGELQRLKEIDKKEDPK